MTKELRLQPLSWDALIALLLAMFAISVGYGIVLPILPFLIERISGTTDAADIGMAYRPDDGDLYPCHLPVRAGVGQAF